MKLIKTPSSLQWLINKKARLEGKITKIEEFSPSRLAYLENVLREIERYASEVNEEYQKQAFIVNNELPKLKRQLEAIIIALGVHEITISPDVIRPIRPYPTRLLQFGLMTRDIYIFLKRINGSATTKEIARFIWLKNEINEDQISFVKFTVKVRKRLKDLSLQGKIVRLHSKSTNIEGSWKLPSVP